MIEYRNSDFRALVDEYVHDHRHRKVLIDRFCERYTFEQIAERNDYSTRQVKNIVYRYGDRLFLLLQKERETVV